MHTRFIPHTFVSSKGNKVPFVAIEQIEIPEEEFNGIMLPQGNGRMCETGIVRFVSDGSQVKVGDMVEFKLINVAPEDYITRSVNIDGVDYVMAMEEEIFSANGIPIDWVYVEPMSNLSIGEDGLMTMKGGAGNCQKGRVKRCPRNLDWIKVGGEVVYRVNESKMFPTVNVKGVLCEMVHIKNIYMSDSKVAPGRAIVEINITKQNERRSKNKEGLLLHPNFVHLKRYLQEGRVIQIGRKAYEALGSLVQAGDVVLLHHTVEHFPHLVIRKPFQKHKNSDLFELRVVDCPSKDESDIIGVRTEYKKINIFFGERIECEREIDFLPLPAIMRSSESKLLLGDNIGFNLNGLYSLEQAYHYINQKQKEIADIYKHTHMSYDNRRAMADNLPQDAPERAQIFESLAEKDLQLKTMSRKALEITTANHLAVLTANTKGDSWEAGDKIVATYKELYPLTIDGEEKILAYRQLVLGSFSQSHINTDSKMSYTIKEFKPTPGKIVVLMEEAIEAARGKLLTPTNSVANAPTRSTVVKAGSIAEGLGITANTKVWFKPGIARAIHFEEGTYLVMDVNDIDGHASE